MCIGIFSTCINREETKSRKENPVLNKRWVYLFLPLKRGIFLLSIIVVLVITGCAQNGAPSAVDEPEQQTEQDASQEPTNEPSNEEEKQGEASHELEEQQEEPQDEQQEGGDQNKQSDIPTAGNGSSEANRNVPDFTTPDSILVLVNKERPLPADYKPADLVEPNVPFSFAEKVEKRLMRAEAARALERLFAASEEEGLSLYAVSGFRSYERQEAIFAYNASLHGEEKANQFSARPGQSEHQTGLAMDVSSPAVQFDLIEEFANTPEGKWLAENAARFGFIIRYPKDKTEITQYQYEPWHLRYVGIEAALEMAEQNLTLEEYYNLFHNQ